MYLLENAEGVLSSVAEVADANGLTFAKSGIENLADNASFGERLAYALKYAAIGISTVFMVLVIIMAVLYVFKLVSVISAKKKASAPAAPVKAPAVGNAGASPDDEEVIVAVATAAIAAARGESDCAFNVISINKIQ